jgi:hypothetical protein
MPRRLLVAAAIGVIADFMVGIIAPRLRSAVRARRGSPDAANQSTDEILRHSCCRPGMLGEGLAMSMVSD